VPKSKLARRATYVVLGGNVLLLLLKAWATTVSDSLAIFSETINSLTDVGASVAVLVSVRAASRAPDDEHPFGHSRAEPIAGLVVAIFTGIMGWEVLHSPLDRLTGPAEPLYIGPYALPVLAFTLILKAAMTWYLLRRAHKVHSPALRASAIDCRNDMMVAVLAMVGVSLGNVSPTVDAVAAFVIGGYIVFNAYAIGRENIDYLMGSTPSQELLAEIRDRAAQVPRVRDVDDVKAHYVGNFVHVELDLLIDGELTTHDSHAVAERARAEVESLEVIDRAFIHVEPTTARSRH
jgi:cation diffusion facilitator family transporter